ncbi:coiled-coil domain-containing protein 105 [Suncus etruscus]|uniref:coiled-coil domain-containing protein 105 n=1 Tax=Suncus etruscus TaxID=109475 RepID=UPI0021104F69|nr:coiled-coil domain-containing protein 105 [Suncus etruscus]
MPGVPQGPAVWVGAAEWRGAAEATVRKAERLTERCALEAARLWQPRAGPRAPSPAPGPGPAVPLPLLRDARAQHTAALVRAHARGTRLVAARLGRALQQLERQLRRLLRQRQATGQRLRAVRGGLLLNRRSAQMRGARPEAEKIPDKADSALAWERQELQALKSTMEKDMDKSEALLQTLASCRDAVQFNYRERAQVLDLINQPLDKVLEQAGRHSWLDLTRTPTPQTKGMKTPSPDPLGAYTPECAALMREATRLLAESADALQDLAANEAAVSAQQEQMCDRVCSTLVQKMRETTELKEKLTMAFGLMRGAIHRSNKFNHEMSITHGLIKGPISKKHLEVREKLDRPLVRVFQRHVGTQLPEASRLGQGTDQLQRHMAQAEKNLSELHEMREHLARSLACKKLAQEVDHKVVRLRLRQRPMLQCSAAAPRQGQGQGEDREPHSPPPPPPP